MVSMGKPYSRCRSFNDAVSLTIFIAIDNAQFVKFITDRIKQQNYAIGRDDDIKKLNGQQERAVIRAVKESPKSLDETKKSCNELVNRRLIEIVGKELC